MTKITTFEQLDCWKASRILVNSIFDICDKPEIKYQFRFKDQLTGAALSIMNNIAEGFSRYSETEFIRFLNIAAGSNSELLSMSYILSDRNIINESEFYALQQQINITGKTTNGLIRYLNSKRTN